MNQPQRLFDTLQYAKQLQAVGFTAEQAEVQAEVIKGLIDEKLATKEDLRYLEERMNHRFNEIDHRFSEIEHKISEMGYKIIISLGSMIAAGIVILGAIIKLV